MLNRKMAALAMSVCLCFASACAGPQAAEAGESAVPEEPAVSGEAAEEAGTPDNSLEETDVQEEAEEARTEEAGTEEAGMKETETEEAGPAAELPRHDSGEDILLIVDFQNVCLPGQPWACPTMEQAMENTLKIARTAGAPDYVLTKFMPPENPEGCWVRYNEENAEINADPFYSELPDMLTEIAADGNVVELSTYSAMDSEQIQARTAGKKRIALAGVSASCCVLATMLDAIDLGYEVIYLDDCVSGYSEESERTVRELAEAYAPVHTRIMSSGDYLRSIAAE